MTTIATALSTITPGEKAQFISQGYLHLKGIVPEVQLISVQRPLEQWANTIIQSWVSKGLLDKDYADMPFDKRLYQAWITAGKPNYSRSPRGGIVSKELFDLMCLPSLVNLAQDLIENSCIAAHGAFNGRAKLSDQLFTDTPWHQDAQYFRKSAGDNIITMWIPLVDVDESNSCLQVAPRKHNGPLYDNYDDKSGFIGLPPEDRKKLVGKPIPMKRGDLLCFNEMLPHAAMPNSSELVRWSIDLRYEAVDNPRSTALEKGFICAHSDPDLIEPSFDSWYQKKWRNHSVGW